ncbi:MAG TPA: tetratricopeptide repeat protein, partial [Opitutaceae bacterium]|nr:tetratricopeptide repeat protein [Opitutaceae bacterium]
MLALLGAGLALAAYLSIAGAVFGIVRYHRGVEGARLADAVVPSRWPRFRIAQGNHLINVAFQLVQRGKRREALSHVRAGVAQSPGDRSARLLLARLLIEANRPDTAQQVLLEGVPFHCTDPRYLEPVFAFLIQRQADAQVVTLARGLLPAGPAHEPSHGLVALAGATASFLRGHYDLAEDFIGRVPQLQRSREGRLLAARIDWECGHGDLALLRLRALADELPRDAEIHGELVARLRQTGHENEARRRSLALQIAEPKIAAPRLALLQLAADANDAALIARESAGVLNDFTDAPTLAALSEFAANSGDAPLAQRVADRAAGLGLPVEPHVILRIEALLVAREYRAALGALRDVRASPDRRGANESLLDSLQAVAHLGLGERETARVFIANL